MYTYPESNRDMADNIVENVQNLSQCHSIADVYQYHTKELSLAQDVDDRAREGQAYGNLGK